EDNKESGALPERRRGDQAVVAGHPRYRGQTRPPTSEGERPTRRRAPSPGPTGRRRGRPRLETSPRRSRPGLPRPDQPLPRLTIRRSTYTEILTGSRASRTSTG